jgi:iron-sulfur cluster repair protein YtfE (RIC family)
VAPVRPFWQNAAFHFMPRAAAVTALSFDLDHRTGWPAELRVLLDRYPRHTWRARRSGMAEFWLDIHEGFRREVATLRSAAGNYRERHESPQVFGAWLMPRLQSFVSHLHGHHQIEDFHYFPAFRAADQRLARGIDALGGDHDLLHGGIAAVVEAANTFFAVIREGDGGNLDPQLHAGDTYVDASERLHERLLRHLDDEEDLIIPLMLHGGQQG